MVSTRKVVVSSVASWEERRSDARVVVVGVDHDSEGSERAMRVTRPSTLRMSCDVWLECRQSCVRAVRPASARSRQRFVTWS
jgi:hypothetical protein